MKSSRRSMLIPALVACAIIIALAALFWQHGTAEEELNNQLLYAVLKGDNTAVTQLLREGADPNAFLDFGGRGFVDRLLRPFRHPVGRSVLELANNSVEIARSERLDRSLHGPGTGTPKKLQMIPTPLEHERRLPQYEAIVTALKRAGAR